jgi:hypothetical protein
VGVSSNWTSPFGGVIFLPLDPASGLPHDVNLAWDPSPATSLAGYRLYSGAASRHYSSRVDVGNQTTYTLTGLGEGPYYFAVTAYDALGAESGYSNEVVWAALSAPWLPPGRPLRFPNPGSSAATRSRR